MKRPTVLCAITCLTLLFFLVPPSSAQLNRLNVGYSAVSADQLPAWVAKETGIFARNGLDVRLFFFTGGTTAILALKELDGSGFIDGLYKKK
jgi:ABC-type nitrate/sulfonate/bicarbonate transport system substrate-binding protein